MENEPNSFSRISKIDFSFLIQNYSEEEILNQAELLRIQNKWEEIVGPYHHEFSFPFKINKNELNIIVNHSGMKMEILLLKPVILKNLNKNSLKDKINKLSFFIGKVPEKKQKFFKKEGTIEGKAELLDIVSKISDKKIQNKMFELLKVL